MVILKIQKNKTIKSNCLQRENDAEIDSDYLPQPDRLDRAAV